MGVVDFFIPSLTTDGEENYSSDHMEASFAHCCQRYIVRISSGSPSGIALGALQMENPVGRLDGQLVQQPVGVRNKLAFFLRNEIPSETSRAT